MNLAQSIMQIAEEPEDIEKQCQAMAKARVPVTHNEMQGMGYFFDDESVIFISDQGDASIIS